MTSGERIKQLRLERNWSQARLAKEVGLHTSSIQDWEAGISLHPQKCLIGYVIYSTPRPTIFFAEPMKNLLVFMAFRHMSRF